MSASMVGVPKAPKASQLGEAGSIRQKVRHSRHLMAWPWPLQVQSRASALFHRTIEA